ncbi:MAG TPA: thioredoxin domain-containing protein [Pyrinomonadaceae bacterium]|nr:thioredoxin domain-containing protein [Pyrinomonadaceae bacterium]
MKRLLPFAIIIVVLTGAAAAGWVLLRSSRQQAITSSPTPDPAGEVKGAEPPHVRGNPNAAVTVEEFGDFQCPTCGTYYAELKKIEGEFGDKLKVIFRELPLLPMHEHALMAAQAAEAAGLQGKFWEMHDLLYENQTKWVTEKDLVPVFADYAKQVGLNPDQFMKDLNGETVAQRIFQDGKRAHSLGLKGTPSFFVNGKEATGDQWRPEGLRQMIKDALAASGK